MTAYGFSDFDMTQAWNAGSNLVDEERDVQF